MRNWINRNWPNVIVMLWFIGIGLLAWYLA